MSLLNLATHTTGGMPLQLPAEVKGEADLMAYFRKWSPPAAPGTVRTYANPSAGLLGVAAARAPRLAISWLTWRRSSACATPTRRCAAR